MSRYARKKDNNQNEIVEQIRWNGYAVIDLSFAGSGIPDLLLSKHNDMWLVEIKSKYGKLTPKQIEFHQNWSGKPIIVAFTVEELLQKLEPP